MWIPSSAGVLLLASAAEAYLVPHPTGKYNVSLTTGPLTDHTRKENNPANAGPRTLMLSIFEPAACAATVPVEYLPNKTADFQGPFLQQILNTTLNVTPLFKEARLPVCPIRNSSCRNADDFPIVLFSPGYSIPRLYYNFMASAIASEGFMVITTDHPGDSNFITYPNGDTSISNDTVQGPENILARLHPRIDDVSFLLDQLSNVTSVAELLPHRGPRPLPTDRVAMAGHSLGGIAAVLAAEQDERLRGAINWDGNMLEIPSDCGVSQPVLLMSKGFLFPSWDEMLHFRCK
ncbi:putative 1-alkyl-2-acetylglycerophosphocholine esterase [Fulvia fulva]|uniref:1-alkyl-2-acetylglycerophosphocholine esterase n=1 Tax=Passalora fulva TaxID=5499 RepID=A0A9Q8UR07_PASFU|nr:putative 1-alkyl-2-acetylglycerophosphocholine esterase [Fulvia fulva]KAK4622198.1 putative 1-alkyl-2-acetylglycerophosphocholine esterase [Fulvia fulva]KAK4622903.1 putative 1-alkyl-2-acetylglycerophosphocholine esterase [Fulvia fulva]UJO19242.1 putative 1-alkyl-2-acetylglycerophosphocholine esterase [Fulvia fulva]WPV16220.1 putative 1-alkyl-2-acetylglycerophosphocholine esterase [Fulvia fulva]WPV31709.1 putative 1-alkyl-2-acetylglycerophosphocholine esterase [Fulvia fulva]